MSTRRRFSGADVQALRESMGLTIGEMAKRIPIHRRTLMRWERGTIKRPIPATVRAVDQLRREHENRQRGEPAPVSPLSSEPAAPRRRRLL